MSTNGKAAGENLMIQFSSIEIDLDFNSRTVYDDIPELAKSIDAHGLITPLTVTKTADGKIKLVAGYRRYQALEKLEWGDKPVKVSFEHYDTDGDLYIANLVENTARKDMRNADLAKRFYELENGTYRRIINPAAEGEEDTVGTKLSRKDIARHTGLSTGHIGNLIRSYEQLGPSVMKMWGKLDIPLTQVIKWAAITKTEVDEDTGKKITVGDDEKQLEQFGEWKQRQDEEKSEGKPKRKKAAKSDEGDSEEGEEGEEAEGEANPPTKRQVKEQIEILEAKFEKLEGEKLAVAKGKHKALRWVLGQVDTSKNV